MAEQAFWKIMLDANTYITKCMETDPHQALDIATRIMSRFFPSLDIALTIDARNCQKISTWKNQIQICISARGLINNCEQVEKLYLAKPKHLPPNWHIVKYRPYAPYYLKSIPYSGTHKLAEKDVTFTHFHAVDEHQKILINLRIYIDNKYADFLEEKEVTFGKATANDTPDIAPRKVLLPKYNALDQYLFATLGEANLTHYIGNIEIYWNKDAAGEQTHPDLPRNKLYELPDIIKEAWPTSRVQCVVCNISSDCVDIYECVCGCNIKYCSDLCKNFHQKTHDECVAASAAATK